RFPGLASDEPGDGGEMGDSQASFDQVNLVVGDMDAALDFYRRLGVTIGRAPEWPPGSGARHAEGDPARAGDNPPAAAAWWSAFRSLHGRPWTSATPISLPPATRGDSPPSTLFGARAMRSSRTPTATTWGS